MHGTPKSFETVETILIGCLGRFVRSVPYVTPPVWVYSRKHSVTIILNGVMLEIYPTPGDLGMHVSRPKRPEITSSRGCEAKLFDEVKRTREIQVPLLIPNFPRITVSPLPPKATTHNKYVLLIRIWTLFKGTFANCVYVHYSDLKRGRGRISHVAMDRAREGDSNSSMEVDFIFEDGMG